jgi:chromosome segregation ATPase
MTTASTQQNDDDVKNDVQVIDEMIARLESDNEQIAQTMEDTQRQIETESAPYLKQLSEDSATLKEIEKEAEEEENKGQIGAVQAQIDEM